MRRRIDRRQFFRRAAALGISVPAAAAILAACVGGTGSPANGSATPEVAGGPTAGTLRIRIENDIASLDPAFIPTGVDGAVCTSINEGLVTYKPGTFDIVNQLADTFTRSADGLAFDFTLKQGIPFHGNYGELTAEDVKFSFERIADPTLRSPYVGDWAALKEVKVKDKYSGTIILKEPFVALSRGVRPCALDLAL